MNKQKFVDLLRQPETISTSSLDELEQLVVDNPYFHCGHIVIARASRHLKSEQTGKKINTAAIYATSRKAFKNYIQGDVIFEKSSRVVAPQQKEEVVQKTSFVLTETKNTSTTASPQTFEAKNHLSQLEHDSLINEVYQNIEEWKKSRNQFLDYELSIEEPKSKSEVDKLKSQIAEEIIAEEEQVSKALKGIEKKEVDKKKDSPTNSSETDKLINEDLANSEESQNKEELADEPNDDSLSLSKQKENLKLSPANKGGKKFRLNILRPAPKSKAEPTKKAAPARKNTNKATSGKSSKTTKEPTAKKSQTKGKSTTGKTKKTDLEDGKKKKPKETLTQTSPRKKVVIEEQIELIDKFISANPSIDAKKNKGDNEPNIDLSEKNKDFPSDIVTENMAKIFESQGKMENAISIYEQLILKNPEKKSYFATRIKNLKNK
ncbi:hypothetical protein [Reichenbachiella sp. MALMAid0571]|uniref:tetratricopeptide repeat protein n=1 Tax=Reichenbachiella sp. MALMAid0571 TaxID=3143939 RepID=UPI0032DE39DE